MATYSDDEGDDERDKSASADDEMAFIDDAFFELPDVATEEEAEGGGARVSTVSRVRGARARGARAARAANGRARGENGGTSSRRSGSWIEYDSNFGSGTGGAKLVVKPAPAKTTTTATRAQGATTRRHPTAQQSQDRASNHPKRAIRTMAARQTTSLQ